MLGNKGFGKLSTLFDKFIFKLLANFAGNLYGVGHLAGMSDSFDTVQTAGADQNSAREIIKRGGETYKLHSIHGSGTPIYKRVWGETSGVGSGFLWYASHTGFKSLSSAKKWVNKYGSILAHQTDMPASVTFEKQ